MEWPKSKCMPKFKNREWSHWVSFEIRWIWQLDFRVALCAWTGMNYMKMILDAKLCMCLTIIHFRMLRYVWWITLHVLTGEIVESDIQTIAFIFKLVLDYLIYAKFMHLFRLDYMLAPHYVTSWHNFRLGIVQRSSSVTMYTACINM